MVRKWRWISGKNNENSDEQILLILQTIQACGPTAKDALPILSSLCNCLGHQDQVHYVPKVMDAIKSIGPDAIPYLEEQRDSKPPESRLKRILELLEAMQ